MVGQKMKIAGLVAAMVGGSVAAQAGGLERSSQDFDILFEQGNIVEGGATLVMPQRKLKNISRSDIGKATGGINLAPGASYGKPYETSVDEAKAYWVPKISARFQLTDDLACAAQYREPWGIHSDVGTSTERMFTAIEQKITSRDYGLNCSYRFAAGEKGFFRLLGGVSYQELKGYQTKMIPDANPANWRAATLDVEDESLGWRLGAAYEIPEIALRASLSYQSEVKYKLTGTIDNLAPIPINVFSDIATPQSVEFKFQTGIAPDWLALGSVKWTDWKSLQRADFLASDSIVYPVNTKITALNLEYKDGWTVVGGVGHKFNDQWSGAATLTWDRATTTGLTSQTDIWLLGLGTNYTPNKNVELRLAGAVGFLTSGILDDRGFNSPLLPDTGSSAKFGNDFVSALSVSAKIKF